MLDYIKRDALKAGMLVGMVAPAILFAVVTLVMSHKDGLIDYLQSMLYLGSLSKVLSLCVYPNLGIFYLYLHFKKETTARGVVWGTFAMAIIVAVIYLIQKIG